MKLFVLLLEFSLWSIISLVCAITLTLSSFYLYLNPDLPPVSMLKETQLQTPLKVFTQDGKLIAEFGETRRIPLTLSEVPPTLINAILTAEDDRFYSHQGVSLKALARASFDLISTGSIQSGGSTITMQVAKNFFLSNERTFIRKFNEIILALQIESELSKEEILELYINKIFLGHRAYGFGAAAQIYYGKPLAELDLAEFAMLASLPKSPSKSNPITNPEKALNRRNWILNRMLKLALITPEEHKQASSTPVVAGFHALWSDVEASHLAEMVRIEMLQRFGQNAYTDGFSVYTTLSAAKQQAANQAVRKGLIDYDQRHGFRGPIERIDISNDDFSDPDFAKTITDKLKDIPIADNYQAALITSLDQDKAKALLKDQSEIHLDSNSVAWARPFINVNALGATPKSPADILKVGDIVYVTPRPNGVNTEQQANEKPEVVDNAAEITSNTSQKPQPHRSWSLVQIPEAQGALIALNPDNGAILALVGGFDYSLSRFNRVLQAQRQAGSNFKPFIYAAALENGFTAASIINDAPVVFEDASLEATWRPENSSGKFFGPTRLREALYKSRNLVSIRLLRSLSIPKAIDYVKIFGFDPERLPRDLSLALGSAAVTPLEMATGFAVLANGGYKIEPYFIDHITDNNDEIIFQANPAIVCRPPCVMQTPTTTLAPDEETKDSTKDSAEAITDNQPANSVEEEVLQSETVANIVDASEQEYTPPPIVYAPRVMDERVNYILNSILRDVITKGTGRKASLLGRSDLAGKTGTTNNQLDAWFSGFNTAQVVVTWVGFDDPQTLGAREFGARAALPIWIDYMANTLAGTPQRLLSRPDGLITMRIDQETGEVAAPGQEGAIFETFREEYAPKKQSNNTINAQHDDLIPNELF